MSNAPFGLPHDPLRARFDAAAETLNRRRREVSETSKQIAGERNEFFYKLAILNAGALTFSVTLLAHPVRQSLYMLFDLYAAWLFLLFALGACLLRNLSHQGYRFSDVAAKRIESEISYIDADGEIVSSRTVIYADASEPFDREREIRINKENREAWQAELSRHQPQANRKWRLVVVMEWTAGICTFAGLLLLIVFAILSTLPTASLVD